MYSKNKMCENKKLRERQLSSEYKYSKGTLINNSTYIKTKRHRRKLFPIREHSQLA